MSFVDNYVSEATNSKYLATVVVDFDWKKLMLHQKGMKMQIIDTSDTGLRLLRLSKRS